MELSSTAADLIGDHLVLEAAKESILLTEKCHAYLRRLPATSLTSFLRDLSASASALSIPVPQPPLTRIWPISPPKFSSTGE